MPAMRKAELIQRKSSSLRSQKKTMLEGNGSLPGGIDRKSGKRRGKQGARTDLGQGERSKNVRGRAS